MQVFQDVYFLPFDLLGICVYLDATMKEDCVFCDFETWPLAVPTRSHDLFLFFHNTSPPRTQTNTSTCDLLGTLRYCPLKFKKLSWFQIFELFWAAIFQVLGAKKTSLQNGVSLTKATLYLKLKKIWDSQYTKVSVLLDSCRQWLLG